MMGSDIPARPRWHQWVLRLAGLCLAAVAFWQFHDRVLEASSPPPEWLPVILDNEVDESWGQSYVRLADVRKIYFAPGDRKVEVTLSAPIEYQNTFKVRDPSLTSRLRSMVHDDAEHWMRLDTRDCDDPSSAEYYVDLRKVARVQYLAGFVPCGEKTPRDNAFLFYSSDGFRGRDTVTDPTALERIRRILKSRAK